MKTTLRRERHTSNRGKKKEKRKTEEKKQNKKKRLARALSRPRRRNDNSAEARAAEILKYILKNYFSMENSDNKSNKKAIMEVWCGEKPLRTNQHLCDISQVQWRN